MIKVIKIKPHEKNLGVFRYIGRTWAGYPESIFQNPFHVGKDGDREEVLLKFLAYWYAPEQKWLRDQALKIIHDGDVLGCWCKPLQCHGDIIAGYVEWRQPRLF